MPRFKIQGMSSLSIRIPADTKAWLTEYAKVRNKSMTDIILELLKACRKEGKQYLRVEYTMIKQI